MYIADLHIHSKYSRATSRDGDAPHLDLWARRKASGCWARVILHTRRGGPS